MSIQQRIRLSIGLSIFILMLTFGASLASAESLVVPFFIHIGGDDDSESRYFDTPFPDEGVTLLTLDGFVVNLHLDDTAHGVGLHWFETDGSARFLDMSFSTPAFDPVIGPVQIPFHLQQRLDFTSEQVGFFIEGTGPGDSLDFTGTFTYSQIPEPSTFVLATIALFTLLPRYRRRRRT